MIWTKRKQLFVLAVIICAQCCFWIIWKEEKSYATLKQPELQLMHGSGQTRERSEARSSEVHSGINKSRGSQPSDPSNVTMVIGIVTAERHPPTVFKMVKMLVDKLDFKRFQVVVWQSISIRDLLTKQTLEGMGVRVLGPMPPYQELQSDNIERTYNDTIERVLWRSNHVLDYASLLEACLNLYSNAKYLLILEDDVWPAKNAVEKSYQFAEEHFAQKTDWAFLTLYSGTKRKKLVEEAHFLPLCGAVALLYRRAVVNELIKFLRLRPFLAPVDLLIPSLLMHQLHLRVFERTPNLFQHAGYKSSYSGKDAPKRGSEFWRSRTYMRDEDNITYTLYAPDSKTGYIGCFIDQNDMHDLDGIYVPLGTKNPADSHGKCKGFCHEYSYFGLQNGGECRCGNQFGLYGKVDDKHCNMSCQSQPSNMCGGPGYNSVFLPVNVKVKFLGCYQDSKSDRDLTGKISLGKDRSPKRCSQFCDGEGYKYFGLQYGGECFCGDFYGKHGKISDSQCDFPCKDDDGEKCGGVQTNSVYEILG